MRPLPPTTADRALPVVRAHGPVTGLAIVLAVLLAACAGTEAPAAVHPAELEELREEVATLSARDTAREERLEDMETTTDRLSRADPTARLIETERELARLVDTLTVFDEELAAAVTDNEQRDAQTAETTEELAGQNAALLEANERLGETVGELQGQLDSARGRLDRVSGELEDLEIRYETLRDRLDRAGR